MSDFELLAQPIRIGNQTLKNRIVHSAILTHYVQDQNPTDAWLTYHANRARGGAAMIITEAVNALSGQRVRPGYLNAFDDTGFPGLQRAAECVRQHDCLILAQLQDRGGGNYSNTRVDTAFGPSALPDDLARAVPQPLTIGEIKQMVAEFAAAAERLQRAGFNGVEISAGHGHLFHQFLSARSNRRDDAYGGDLPGRSKFLKDVICAVRETCGRDFILGLKLPADDGLEDGIDLEQARQFTRALVTPDQVDYAAFVWGSQSSTLYWHVPDGHFARTPYVEQAAGLRQHANGVPVMALGRIVDPHEAQNILARDQADFIGLGRAMITDPAWPAKALGGQSHAIRHCVSCSTCWAVIASPSPLVCDNNPALASPIEVDGVPPLNKGLKRLIVVGGGVAGMEAAWVAAARGHDVTLYSAGPEIGGRARLMAGLPGSEGLASVYDYQVQAARRHGVQIELGHKVSVEEIVAATPDAVVLATGADMAWPDVLPARLLNSGVAIDLAELIPALGPANSRQTGKAVVIDEDNTMATCNAALWLADRFDEVILLTSQEAFATREALVQRQSILDRLRQRGITLLPLSKPDLAEEELAEGQVGYRNVTMAEREILENVAVLTYAAGRIPRLELLDGLRAAGIAPQIIGDAFAPRGLLQATAEGHAAAMDL